MIKMLKSRHLTIKIVSSRLKVPKLPYRCFSDEKTYYDSQSGMHMKVPGSGGFIIHDVGIRQRIVSSNHTHIDDFQQYYQRFLNSKEFSSFSMDISDCNDKSISSFLNSSNTEDDFKLSQVSVAIQSYHDFDNLFDILVAEKGDYKFKSPFQLEVDCLSLTSLALDDSKDSDMIQSIQAISNFSIFIAERQLTKVFRLRVNLYLDITSLLSTSNQVTRATPVPSALTVMSMVGNLCDLQGVEVVNLVFCSAVPLHTLTKGVHIFVPLIASCNDYFS